MTVKARRIWMAVAIAWAIVHVAAIFTENVNWDEFALLHRVERFASTGTVQGGGRPGAIEVLLWPIVQGCQDAITAVRKARILGAGATLFAILGLFELVRRACAPSRHAEQSAWLAVGLWALALPFQRWSIQIRTDQFGVLFGVWGAVVLMGVRSVRSAALAGACFGAGFLFTQKVLYVALLAALLRAARGPLRTRADLLAAVRDAVAVIAAFVCVVAGTRWILSLFFTLPPLTRVESGLRTFDDYRRTFGFALHRGLLAAIVAHWVAVALLVAASLRALRVRRWQRHLGTAWALLVAGTGVAVFHTAAFPYFWITLGLFPAVALGISYEAWSDVIPSRVRSLTIALFSLCLLVPSSLYAFQLLDDTQKVQRDALRVTSAELGPPVQGFQAEGALLCREQSDSFPLYFRHHIEAVFAEPGSASKASAFIARFREKPVHFIVDSHMTGFFPKAVTEFWQSNYVPYRGPVRLAGRALGRGETVRWDVFASGRYRWFAADSAHVAEIEIDGATLSDRRTLWLARGPHVLHARGAGLLVYAVHSDPVLSGAPFYAYQAIREIIGGPYFRP